MGSKDSIDVVKLPIHVRVHGYQCRWIFRYFFDQFVLMILILNVPIRGER